MDKRVIENIKMLGIDAINKAGSGHPGIVLGAAPIIYSVFANHLCVDSEFKSLNRDRFVMSAGHGSALLYSTFYAFGLLEMEDVKNFRRINSKTPGHPEVHHTKGVEMTTGPLGQGVAGAVGMALAAKIRGFNSKVYVLCGDGDLMEGVAYEALSLAGRLNLNNLIVLYDSNDITLDSNLSTSFNESMIDRFKAINFNTFFVKDGNDLSSLNSKIEKSKKSKKPNFIEVKTVIGEGSSVAGKNDAHGKPLSSFDIEILREGFGLDSEFSFSDELREYAKNKLASRYIETIIEEENKINLNAEKYKDITTLESEMRSINSLMLKQLSLDVPNLIGGSADLGGSTKTNIDNTFINKDDYSSKNIYYGVREHAMGTITNGLALSNFRPYSSTFLAFADYMKPSIRQAAIMNIPSIFMFTHDSITIGQDGPTHQPVEQLALLRSIPNLNVFRPADAKELFGAYQVILTSNRPSSLILSRDKTILLDNTDSSKVKHGAYIVLDYEEIDGIIIATGTEVDVALRVSKEIFRKRNIKLRVVSMPSQNLFIESDKRYRDEILPIGVKRIVIEAGSSYGWHRFVYADRYLITIDTFGASGTKDEVLEYMNFSFDQILKRVSDLLD